MSLCDKRTCNFNFNLHIKKAHTQNTTFKIAYVPGVYVKRGDKGFNKVIECVCLIPDRKQKRIVLIILEKQVVLNIGFFFSYIV